MLINIVLSVLRKVFDWFMALSPSQQLTVARSIVEFVDWLNKSYHSWITWCKHWYDTRHRIKNNDECYVNNKKEQHYLDVMLFLILLYAFVHDLL